MPKSKPVVALIEDDLMIGEMYKAKFAKNGFEIQIATDGAAGLELVKKTLLNYCGLIKNILSPT